MFASVSPLSTKTLRGEATEEAFTALICATRLLMIVAAPELVSSTTLTRRPLPRL